MATAGKHLFNTIPIVLAGSMAASLGLTAPIPVDAAKRVQPTVKATTPKPTVVADKLGPTALTGYISVANATPGTAETVTPTTETPSAYQVQPGDTLASIAAQFGLATASVIALNGLSWSSTIFPGQQLKLTADAPVATSAPTPPPAPAPAPRTTRYTIKAGDTIGRIATSFGISTQALLSANGLSWSSIIYPGQALTIPSGGGATIDAAPVSSVTPIASASSYTIQAGDTLSSIAAKFGVGVTALVAANGITTSTTIYSGHSLTIPAGSTTSPGLTTEMAGNARTIIQVGRSLGVPDYGIVIALATALQESGLRNLPYGDRDSLGLFQQRPSAGWGSPSQLLDPSYAARLFYGGPKNPNKGVTRGLLDISGWQSMTVTQAAQAVQRSAFPNAYAKWEATARAALTNLG